MKHITSYKNKKSQKIRHFLPINITVASRTKIKSRKPLQIKGFWDFAHYSNSMKAILDIIQTDIIPNYTFVDDKFSNMQNDKIFRYGFSYDFNDSVLLEIAKQYKSILVTDDADFGNYDSNITIVTNNRKLLMFS